MQSTHLFLFRIVVYLRAAAYLTGDSNLSKPLSRRPDDHGSEDDADFGDESELFGRPLFNSYESSDYNSGLCRCSVAINKLHQPDLPYSPQFHSGPHSGSSLRYVLTDLLHP